MIVAAVALGVNNLSDLQGRTKISSNNKSSAQSEKDQKAFDSSIKGALEVSMSGNTSITLTSVNGAALPATKVYNFKIANHYAEEIKIYKITAQFTQEWLNASYLTKPNGWQLMSTDNKILSYSNGDSNGYVAFSLNSPISLLPSETKTFSAATTLAVLEMETPFGQVVTGTPQITVSLVGDAITTSGPGPVSGSDYNEVNKTNSRFILQAGKTYLNSAYPDSLAPATYGLPTAAASIKLDTVTFP